MGAFYRFLWQFQDFFEAADLVEDAQPVGEHADAGANSWRNVCVCFKQNIVEFEFLEHVRYGEASNASPGYNDLELARRCHFREIDELQRTKTAWQLHELRYQKIGGINTQVGNQVYSQGQSEQEKSIFEPAVSSHSPQPRRNETPCGYVCLGEVNIDVEWKRGRLV